MIIPLLAAHEDGHGKETKTGSGVISHARLAFEKIFFEYFLHPDNTQPDPDSKGVATTGIGIITFTGLLTGLVEIDDNSKPGEEEQQSRHQEILTSAAELEIQPDESQDQRKHVHPVIGLVIGMDAVGHFTLVSQKVIVDKRDAGDGISVPRIPKTFQVILLAGEIPHEITSLHPPGLVRDKIFDIIGHRRLIPFSYVRILSIGIHFTAIIAAVPHTGKNMGGRRIAPILTHYLSGYLIYFSPYVEQQQ